MTFIFIIARKINNIFDGLSFGLYTVQYEYYKQVFFASVNRNICGTVADSYGIGMDDADYVHDEVFVKLWG